MTGKEFAQWMDSNGITNQVAAELFGVSEQNVYNWRSTRGVPPSKLDWVRTRMAEHEMRAPASGSSERLTLELTIEQFDRWDDASTRARKRLKQWAIDLLDEAAAEQGHADDSTPSVAEPDPLDSEGNDFPLVAEPKTPYPRPAGTASPGDSSPSESASDVA